MLNIYLTNLGKYNEGELVGEWVTLPCEDFGPILDRIGISDEPDAETGTIYEEYFITDFESDFNVHVDEFEDLDDCNALAEALEGADAEAVGALMEYGYELEDAIETAADCIYHDTDDMADIAYEYVNESGMLDNVPDVVARYFDYEAMGRDMAIEGAYIPCGDGLLEVL